MSKPKGEAEILPKSPTGATTSTKTESSTLASDDKMKLLSDVVYFMLTVMFVCVSLMGIATIALWYQAITAKQASYEELTKTIIEQNDAITNLSSEISNLRKK